MDLPAFALSVLGCGVLSGCGGDVLAIEMPDASGVPSADASSPMARDAVASLDAATPEAATSGDDVDAAQVPEIDAGPPPDRPSPGPCPSEPPHPGDPCIRDKLQCEYGSSQYLGCNSLFTCEGTTWGSTFTGQVCPIGPNQAGCAPTFAAGAAGGPCGMDVLTCHYDLGQCYCGQHFNEPPAPPGWVNTWSCEVPTPGCPTWRPRAGTACDGSQRCPYQECAVEARCIEGVWIALYSINC